jgi:hypothetical protein
LKFKNINEVFQYFLVLQFLIFLIYTIIRLELTLKIYIFREFTFFKFCGTGKKNHGPMSLNNQNWKKVRVMLILKVLNIYISLTIVTIDTMFKQLSS